MALPGVTTTLKNRFYTLSRNDAPNGPRVLAIASRNTANGTGGVFDYDPVRILNEEAAILAFGRGSHAHRAYLELAAGGASRISIVALPKGITDAELHSTSNVTLDLDGTDHNHGLHNPFDAAFDAAEADRPDVIVPWGRGGHPTEWETVATPNNGPEFGFYADNTSFLTESLAKRVADKCRDISGRSQPCFAVMGVKPWGPHSTGTDEANQVMTTADIANHVSMPDLANRNLAEFGDNGMYLSVVGTELTSVRYPAAYGYANGAAHYAAAITQLRSWSAPTGKLLYNVSGLRYNPTRTQAQTMIDKGVVPVTLNFDRTPVWVDAMTFALKTETQTSVYARLTTLRIVFDVINLVRQAAAGFIGEGATLQVRNALDTAISASLRQMQILGAVLSSDFNVTFVPQENRAIVDLVITPAFEIRNIDLQVSLQL